MQVQLWICLYFRALRKSIIVILGKLELSNLFKILENYSISSLEATLSLQESLYVHFKRGDFLAYMIHQFSHIRIVLSIKNLVWWFLIQVGKMCNANSKIFTKKSVRPFATCRFFTFLDDMQIFFKVKLLSTWFRTDVFRKMIQVQ